MKKHSIVFKLFIITVMFFSLFLSVFMAGQTLFFKKFYLNMKMSKLEKNIESFNNLYKKEHWESTSIIQNINKFADQNNAQIAILDEDGNAKYTQGYDIVLEAEDGSNIKIPLTSIAYLDGLQDLQLAIGAQIDIEGYFSDDFSQAISISSIKKGNKTWENSNIKLADVTMDALQETMRGKQRVLVVRKQTMGGSEEGLNIMGAGIEGNAALKVPFFQNIGFKKLSGRIVQLNLPSKIEQMANYNNTMLWSAVDYWNWLIMLNKIKIVPEKTTSFHYSGFSNGVDNLVLVKPVVKDNQATEFIFVMSSLQPVGEAVDTMKIYYFYAFLAALLIIAIMALLYSKIISKPLIRMNRVAMKMAELDFTEECDVKSQDELGSLSASLNHLSKKLWASLTDLKDANEKLKLDIEKERNLEKMRKEFVAGVSHEFKTPLSIIKGFAEGIKDNVSEEKKDYYIEIILDEIEKMDELVLDLLDLAKLESKAYKLDIEEFSIIELLDEVQNRLICSDTGKKVNFKLEYDDRNMQVQGDRKRIEQVITNILSNAIRHTEQDGYIVIREENIEDRAYISIENSGEPINEEDLVKIWDRFYRAEKSRDRKTGGTGLGLSIVKNILELHNSEYGAVNIEQGVKFYFTLDILN